MEDFAVGDGLTSSLDGLLEVSRRAVGGKVEVVDIDWCGSPGWKGLAGGADAFDEITESCFGLCVGGAAVFAEGGVDDEDDEVTNVVEDDDAVGEEEESVGKARLRFWERNGFEGVDAIEAEIADESALEAGEAGCGDDFVVVEDRTQGFERIGAVGEVEGQRRLDVVVVAPNGVRKVEAHEGVAAHGFAAFDALEQERAGAVAGETVEQGDGSESVGDEGRGQGDKGFGALVFEHLVKRGRDDHRRARLEGWFALG